MSVTAGDPPDAKSVPVTTTAVAPAATGVLVVAVTVGIGLTVQIAVGALLAMLCMVTAAKMV